MIRTIMIRLTNFFRALRRSHCNRKWTNVFFLLKRERVNSTDHMESGAIFTKNLRAKSSSLVANLGETPKTNGCVSLKFSTPNLFN